MYSINVFLLLGTSLLFFNTIQLSFAKNWAVFLIGIDYYPYTYAFEAGAYKQYNDLVRNGVDPENIIVISPDSAAFHRRNPMPGLVAYAYDKGEFSADFPVNQYEDMIIDYKSGDLEVEDFYQILSGLTSARLSARGSGKVLKTGPNDNVFLYIHTVSHCCIPHVFFFNVYWEFLFPEEFIPVIEELAAAKHFKNMFIHMHSTESGAMFDNYLETNLGIVAYSLGGRYGEFSMCHWNKYLRAYTSTCQGFEHFTYLDKATAKNGAKETILDLYAGSGLTSYDEEAVHNLYGEFDQTLKPIKEFYGPNMKNSQPLAPSEIIQLKKEVRETIGNKSGPITKLLIEETPVEEQDRVEKIMNKIIDESIKNTEIHRKTVDKPLSENLVLAQIECFKHTTKTMRLRCITENSQFLILKHGSTFAKLCNLDVPKEKIVAAIESAC